MTNGRKVVSCTNIVMLFLLNLFLSECQANLDKRRSSYHSALGTYV